MEKFKFKILVCLLLSFTFLIGCTRSGLSYDFKTKEVKNKAKEVVELINNENSQALLEMSTSSLKEDLSEERLEKIYEEINKGGKFDEFGEISVGGEKDSYSEEDFAITVVNTKYENKDFAYTFNFNKEMELAVFYYKENEK